MRTIIFLFLPGILFSQEVVRDSFWLSNQAYITTTTTGATTRTLTYFKHVYFEFEDSTYSQKSTLLGDSSSATYSLYMEQVGIMNGLAGITVRSMDKAQIVKDWYAINNEMINKGLTPLSKITQDAFENQFIGDVRIKLVGQAWQPGDIVKNAQGNLRLLYGNVGFRVQVFAENWIRVIAWPTTGKSLDLFRTSPQTYTSYDKEMVVKIVR